MSRLSEKMQKVSAPAADAAEDPEQQPAEEAGLPCNFCRTAAAALMVYHPQQQQQQQDDNAASRSNRRHTSAEYESGRPYCLLHYYTTKAVLEATAPAAACCVSVVNSNALQTQLPLLQGLFAEAFCDLQQQLAQEAARAADIHPNNNNTDPLAMLTDWDQQRRSSGSVVSTSRPNQNKKKRSSAFQATKQPAIKARRQSVPRSSNDNSNQQPLLQEGGFFRPVPLPERLLQTQRQQAQLQADLTRRMNQAAAANNNRQQQKKRTPRSRTAPPQRPQRPDLSRRRRPSRKSIWNVLLEDDDKNKDGEQPNPKSPPSDPPATTTTDDGMVEDVPTCTCGSDQVEVIFSSHANRNQEMAKGETWGSKDRADVVMSRYRCRQCGKTWNEEE